MNTKIVFAVFLALQVSLTLCETPVPSPDLVEKYNDLKSTFQKRLMNAYEKLKLVAEPLMEKASANENAQVAKDAIEKVKNKPEFGAAMQVVGAIGEEMTPFVDKARSAVLGIYGQYLRPHIGEYLNDGINRIKVVLDQVLPVEN